MTALPVCMSLHHVCAWCPCKSEKSLDPPGTGVKEDCRLLCGFWQLCNSSQYDKPLAISPAPTVFERIECSLIHMAEFYSLGKDEISKTKIFPLLENLLGKLVSLLK